MTTIAEALRHLIESYDTLQAIAEAQLSPELRLEHYQLCTTTETPWLRLAEKHPTNHALEILACLAWDRAWARGMEIRMAGAAEKER